MSTPSPSPWGTTPYELTDAADWFHSLARARFSKPVYVDGSSDFPYNDLDLTSDSQYWRSTIATAFLPVGMVVIFGIPIYWFFLCVRNGCCHNKCYKPCKKLPLCVLPCFCCCWFDEQEGCRKGCPHRNWLCARLSLFVCFTTIVGLNVGVYYSRNDIQSGVDKSADLLGDLSDMFTDLKDYALEMNTTAAAIASAVAGLDCSSDDFDEETSDMSSAASAIGTYSIEIYESIGSLPEDCLTLQDKLTDEIEGYVTYAGLALVALGIVYAVFGLLSTICFQGARHPLKCSSTLMAMTNAFGVLILIIISLLLAAELFAGLAIGDFCSADIGPSNALVSIMDQQFLNDDEALSLFDYYVTCDGTNPMDDYLESQQDAADNITDILTDYQDLLIADTMCCNSSVVSSDDYSLDPDVLSGQCTYYSSSNPNACTDGAVCDYASGTNNGLCTSGGGCSNSSFHGIVDNVDYLAFDDDGPLVSFFGEFTCANINPVISTIVNDVVCDDLVTALYKLVATHMAVLIMTYLVMMYSSFARQVIIEAHPNDDPDDMYKNSVKENELKNVYH